MANTQADPVIRYTPMAFDPFSCLVPYIYKSSLHECTVQCSLSGKFGTGCGSICKCVRGTCDPVTGNCTCDAGFEDETCSTQCQVNVIVIC